MRAVRAVRGLAVLCAAGFAVVAGDQAAAEARLEVLESDGTVMLAFPVTADEPWCLLWNHSVVGFEVHDCFVLRGGRMVLDSSRQPDFAAGLGHVPGRGRLRGDGQGGYLIEGIDEPVPGNRLTLRVGASAVNHRLRHGRNEYALGASGAGRRVEMRLLP